MPCRLFSLSLHDALPICAARAGDRAVPRSRGGARHLRHRRLRYAAGRAGSAADPVAGSRVRREGRGRVPDVAVPDHHQHLAWRSEEHTSELQSRPHLVCRAVSSVFPYTTLFRSVPLGLVIGRFRVVEAALGIYVTAGYAMPLVALVPLLILWLGLGFAVKAAVVFLMSLFPITINTWLGDRKSTRLNSSHVRISYAVPSLQSFPTRRSSDLCRSGW